MKSFVLPTQYILKTAEEQWKVFNQSGCYNAYT